MENKAWGKREMLSDDRVNEIIIEVENIPSGVPSHPSSSQIIPEKTLANSSFSMLSSTSDIDVIDSPIFRSQNDKKSRLWLQFSTSLNESFSQIHRNPKSMGIDALCTSHEKI